MPGAIDMQEVLGPTMSGDGIDVPGNQTPSTETFHILAENGNVLNTEDSNRLQRNQ